MTIEVTQIPSEYDFQVTQDEVRLGQYDLYILLPFSEILQGEINVTERPF